MLRYVLVCTFAVLAATVVPLSPPKAVPVLIGAAREGNVTALRAELAKGSDVNSVFNGVSAIGATLDGWHSEVAKWPAPRSGSWASILSALLDAGASPAVLCPMFDAVAYRNWRALGDLITAANASTLIYCLTARKGAGGGVLAHHIARSPTAGLSRSLFRARNVQATSVAWAELATALGLEAVPQWKTDPGGLGILSKAALEEAAGGAELPLFNAALARALAAVGPQAGALRAAVLAARDVSGSSPLETACAEGRGKVAVWLADQSGAERGAASRCAHLAAARGYSDLLATLARTAAVPLSAADAHLRTPCDVARSLGVLGARSLEVLRDAGACDAASAAATIPCPRGTSVAHWRGARGPLRLPSSFDACAHARAGWGVACVCELEGLGLPPAVIGGLTDTCAEDSGVCAARCATQTGGPKSGGGSARPPEVQLSAEGQRRRGEDDAYAHTVTPSANTYADDDSPAALSSSRVWCPVDALPALALAPASRPALHRDFLELGRPFIVPGAADPASGRACLGLGLPAPSCNESSRPLTRAALLAECGDVRVAGGDIPLAEAYGRSGLHIPLREFVLTHMGGPGASPRIPPPYVFDTSLLLRPRGQGKGSGGGALRDAVAPLYAALVGEGGVPAREQLGMGPPLSGAPPHFHRAAVNLLLVGVKLWAVWPPGAAAFVDGAAEAFWRGHIQGLLSGVGLENESFLSTAAPHYLFLQGPGDALFLPPHWGHATLSLTDTVGIAME